MKPFHLLPPARPTRAAPVRAPTRVLLLALAGGLIPPCSAGAQEPPDSVVRLEPVVVRVLRSSVGGGAPHAVSVVAGEELTRGHAGAYLEEALRSLPGVQVQNRFNLASGERLAIRGFGSRAQFGLRGVRVLLDGIPATLPDGQTALDHLDPWSLERAEILRGPGSALYGNAAGGVLHLETRAPQRALGGALRTSAGSHGLRVTGGSISGPLGPAGFRVTGSRYGYDGFRRDPVADDGSRYGRQERTVVTALVHAPLAGGDLRLVANALDMAAANPGSLSRALLDEGGPQAFRNNVIQRTREDIRQGQAGVTWVGDVAGLEAEVAAWSVLRDFQGTIPSDVVTFDRRAGGARVLLAGSRALGETRVGVGAGVEVEFQSDDRRNWANQAGEKGALRLDQDERVRGTGLFAQARVEPSQSVAVTAGIRWDAFRFSAGDRLLTDGADDSGERVMRALSPSLGMVWRAAPAVELFASLATAFETPTTTELVNRPTGAGGFNTDLSPTRAVTAEGGVRVRHPSSWFMEAVFFRTDLRDELVPFEVPATPGRTFYRNAGESSHQGWEVTLEGRPTPGIWTRVAYTRVDARYRAYAVGPADFSGNAIPGLAPHRLDGRLAGSWGPAFLEVRGLIQGAIPVDDANSVRSPRALLVDVRSGTRELRARGMGVAPFLALANVLDRRYDAAVVVNAFGGRFFEPGPGRNVQAGVEVRLGAGR